jgi:hypothetical protein
MLDVRGRLELEERDQWAFIDIDRVVFASHQPSSHHVFSHRAFETRTLFPQSLSLCYISTGKTCGLFPVQNLANGYFPCPKEGQWA